MSTRTFGYGYGANEAESDETSDEGDPRQISIGYGYGANTNTSDETSVIDDDRVNGSASCSGSSSNRVGKVKTYGYGEYKSSDSNGSSHWRRSSRKRHNTRRYERQYQHRRSYSRRKRKSVSDERRNYKRRRRRRNHVSDDDEQEISINRNSAHRRVATNARSRSRLKLNLDSLIQQHGIEASIAEILRRQDEYVIQQILKEGISCSEDASEQLLSRVEDLNKNRKNHDGSKQLESNGLLVNALGKQTDSCVSNVTVETFLTHNGDNGGAEQMGRQVPALHDSLQPSDTFVDEVAPWRRMRPKRRGRTSAGADVATTRQDQAEFKGVAPLPSEILQLVGTDADASALSKACKSRTACKSTPQAPPVLQASDIPKDVINQDLARHILNFNDSRLHVSHPMFDMDGRATEGCSSKSPAVVTSGLENELPDWKRKLKPKPSLYMPAPKQGNLAFLPGTLPKHPCIDTAAPMNEVGHLQNERTIDPAVPIHGSQAKAALQCIRPPSVLQILSPGLLEIEHLI